MLVAFRKINSFAFKSMDVLWKMKVEKSISSRFITRHHKMLVFSRNHVLRVYPPSSLL